MLREDGCENGRDFSLFFERGLFMIDRDAPNA
jgi:hypothetical protein